MSDFLIEALKILWVVFVLWVILVVSILLAVLALITVQWITLQLL